MLEAIWVILVLIGYSILTVRVARNKLDKWDRILLCGVLIVVMLEIILEHYY